MEEYIIKHKDNFYLKTEVGYKKIILTTNKLLIKDGIQAIDDEFLEWFVKNPSCEEVEVESEVYFTDEVERLEGLEDGENIKKELRYKIIIPKEKSELITESIYEEANSKYSTTLEKLVDSAKEEPNKTHYLDEIPNTDKEVVLKMFEVAIPKSEPKQETLEEAAKSYATNITTDPVSFDENAYCDFIAGAKWQSKRIELLRDALYNQLPTGEVNAFDLIKIINNHIKKLYDLI